MKLYVFIQVCILILTAAALAIMLSGKVLADKVFIIAADDAYLIGAVLAFVFLWTVIETLTRVLNRTRKV